EGEFGLQRHGLLLLELQPLVSDLERLDRHFVAGGIEAGTGPLGRPCLAEVPAQPLLAGLVEQHDRAVSALHLADDRLLAPIPQLGVVGHAHFRVMLEYLLSPGSLRAVNPSVPSRYSIGSWLASRPEHSRNPPRSMPSISNLKLNERNGSLRSPVAMFGSPYKGFQYPRNSGF